MQQRPQNQTRNLLATFVTMLAGAALVTSLVARIRLRRRDPAEISPEPPPPAGEELLLAASSPEPEPMPTEQPAKRQSRTWLILAAILWGTVISLFLPSPAAAIVLLGLVAAAVLVVADDSSFNLKEGADEFRSSTIPALKAAWASAKAHRQLSSVIFTLIALLCFTGAAYYFRTIELTPERTTAVILMIVGAGVLGLAVWLNRHEDVLLTPVDTPIVPARSRGLPVFAGVVTLILLVAINIRLLDIPLLTGVSTHVQFLLWLAGILLIAWGLSGAPPLRVPRVDRGEALLLVLLTVIAFAVRVYNLETGVRTSIDEGHFIDGIRFLRDDPHQPLLLSSSAFLPVTMLPLYFDHAVIGLLGQRSLFSLRFTQVIFGTLNVLAVYGLCRALFNSRRTALIAALVTIGFPLHVHFSRIGMAHIMDTLFGTLTLMFIARGLQSNCRSDWALGGISLGLTQYFFEGGRLLFPPVVIVWIVWLFITRRKQMQEHGRGFLVYTLAAFFVAALVYFPVYATDGQRASRYSDSGLGADYFVSLLNDGLDQYEIDQLLQRATNPFLMYVNRPEMLTQYYGGDQPLVINILVPVFLAGVFYLLWRWREPTFAILIWVVGTALGNSLLHDTWQAPRYVEVTPALAICIGVGIGYVLPLLLRSLRRSERTVTALTVAAAAVVSMVMVAYYFGPHLHLFNRQIRQVKWHGDGVDAVLRAAEQYPPGTELLFISNPDLDVNVPRQVLSFVSDGHYQIEAVNSANVDEAFFGSLPRDVNRAFFIDAADERTYELIQQHFEVEAPQYSPNPDVPASREYILLYAGK